MTRTIILLAAMIVSGTAYAQGVQQSGSITPRHAPMWLTNGVIGDAGGAVGGPAGAGFSEIGITNSGLPFCINDAPITGPYHQLCLGSAFGGATQLTSNALGGATQYPLRFNINGTNYDFPISLSGILGPGTSIVGHPAVWNNTAGSLLAMPDQMQMTPTIGVSGSTVVPSNSSLWINSTRSGTSTTSLTVPLVYINDTETITDVAPANNTIASLYVGKSFGGGEGNRAGIFSFMTNTAPTAGGPTQSINNFYTSIFAATAVTSTDGGTSISPRGDFYGFGGYAIAYSGATYIADLVGAEFDVSVQSGASVNNLIDLQLVLINGHAIHGSAVDTMILITGDGTNVIGVNCGICFGRPYASWPISPTGTIMGTYTTGLINAVTAHNGIDFSQVVFTGMGNTAFKTAGMFIAGSSSSGAGTVAGDIVLFHNQPALIWNDAAVTPTTGGLVRLVGLGTGSFGYQINTAGAGDFSTVLNAFNINSIGEIFAGSNTFPTIGFQSSVMGPTAGGLTRFSLVGGQLSYEINTAVAGDFSSLLTPLYITAAGQVGITFPTLANASVATVLGSVGPTGSHTTVQEWLVVTGGGGATRYVPAF